jgi:protein-S-isoprenylcysteine O-methyltransferase Ste14
MSDLNRRAFAGLLRLVVALAALLFLPAWTLHYWQAWIFLSVFFVSALAITLYLVKNDPKLLERRLNAGPRAEKEPTQRIIQLVATVAFITVVVFPPIDHRFAWSTVPGYVSIAGDVLVFLGLLIIFFVFRENTFTSAVIEVDAQQKVVATGPYALIRHPMYAGALVMLAGMPLALGSLWGLLTIVPITVVIVLRCWTRRNFSQGICRAIPTIATRPAIGCCHTFGSRHRSAI